MDNSKVIEAAKEHFGKVVTNGRSTGATSKEFREYLMATVEDSRVEARWDEYVSATDS